MPETQIFDHRICPRCGEKVGVYEYVNHMDDHLDDEEELKPL